MSSCRAGWPSSGGQVYAAAFSPDGARVVTASSDHTARVWDAHTGKPLTDPLEHRDSVNGAAFSPDGARVITANSGHTARVWELPLNPSSPDDWTRRARCAPFALEDGVLVAN